VVVASCGGNGKASSTTATSPPSTASSAPATTTSPSSTASSAEEWSGVYLALGDSIPWGYGASERTTGSYPALVARTLGKKIELRMLAVPGHTTQDLIDQQLPKARAELAGGDVRLVTVTIGSNDLYELPGCESDPSIVRCPVGRELATVRKNLDAILQSLGKAGPKATIVVDLYANPFSGTGDPLEKGTETAYRKLDQVIAELASKHHVLTADSRPAFAGQGGRLTHVFDAKSDYHPNDAGYRVIAEAFLKVLGVSRGSG
jgi:lysophospholipase L1-like esterase